MQATHVQPGVTVDFKNMTEEIIHFGDVVVMETKVAVAAGDIAPGAIGSVMLEEVFRVEKDDSAISQGAKVYYDQTEKKATAKSEGTVEMGFATRSAAAAEKNVEVKLR